jgi:hypothetical protein
VTDAIPDGPRSTVDRGRTSAATVAAAATRKRRAAERAALDLSVRLVDLPDGWLSRLAFTVLVECGLRGVEVWRDE